MERETLFSPREHILAQRVFISRIVIGFVRNVLPVICEMVAAGRNRLQWHVASCSILPGRI
jgi:hypothetical protein